MSDEYVDEIGEEIGNVAEYSDTEGTYSGNFSNLYKKGIKYYAMPGISTEEAIAIEGKVDIEKQSGVENIEKNNKYLLTGCFRLSIGCLYMGTFLTISKVS